MPTALELCVKQRLFCMAVHFKLCPVCQTLGVAWVHLPSRRGKARCRARDPHPRAKPGEFVSPGEWEDGRL